MTIPLFVLLIIYLALIGIMLIFALYNIYHIIRFGTLKSYTLLISFIFISGIIIILFSAYQNLKDINWHEQITIFKNSGVELPNLNNIKKLIP